MKFGKCFDEFACTTAKSPALVHQGCDTLAQRGNLGCIPRPAQQVHLSQLRVVAKDTHGGKLNAKCLVDAAR